MHSIIPHSNYKGEVWEGLLGGEGVGHCSVHSRNGYCVSVDCKVLILQPMDCVATGVPLGSVLLAELTGGPRDFLLA